MSLSAWVAESAPAQAQVAEAQAQRSQNFDARVDYNRDYSTAPRSKQRRAIQGLRDLAPGLAVTYDRTTGVTRTLNRRGGHLSAERPGAEAMSVARDFITDNYAQLGLTADDLADYEVSDEVYSSVTGATHIYLRQTYLGLPVYNGQLQINVGADGRILSVNNTCMPNIAAAADSEIPALSAAEAVAAVAAHLEIQLDRPPGFISAELSPAGVTRVRGEGISLSDIEARLMWLPIQAGDARLVWNFQIATIGDGQVYDLTVDAASGQVWTRFNWVAQDSYRVYPAPVESPNHAFVLPSADGRETVFDPADPIASPFGWHDTDGLPGAEFTTHRGNNVHAYDDIDNNDMPPAVEPDCGGLLDCGFPLGLTMDPSTYTSAAVTNLFYWSNLIHDVQYLYGFDEMAGNFQENNYGAGGLAGDYVLAEAQDGGGINDANFFTPPDGQQPRMQMFLWNRTDPNRDSDFDNGIIVHEYGHGISNRLVGGPSNVSCLSNYQQPGEGLSDWWSLVYTAQPGDLGTDGRGIGTYALGQPTSGAGIRTQRYSTDPTINTHTYETISEKAIPYGFGEVWAQAAWEVYWALVDAHGFDPDLYNAFGGSGNQRAMLYVNEGLKNTICSPTFTDVRDGIILAAAGPPFNGQDVCLLWEAFAAFGLGEDAVSGGSSSTSPINGFMVPASCLNSDTSPSASIAAPANGATVSGSVTIQVDSSDAEDTEGSLIVEVSIDGSGTWQGATYNTGSGYYEFVWDTTSPGEGPRTIDARAADSGTNTTSATQIGVTVDNVNDPPTASLTDSCTDFVCSFDATGSSDTDGSIVGYSWDFGDESSGTGATPDHTYGAAGTYTVVLTVTDDDGATGNVQQNVTVSEAAVLRVTGLDGASVPAPRNRWNAVATITVQDGGGLAVSGATVSSTWSSGASGGGTCDTDALGRCDITKLNLKGNVVSVTFTVDDVTGPGTYNSNANLVENSIVIFQTEPSGNQSPTASFTYGCTDLSCGFDASGSSDPDGTIASYSWDFGDGNSGTGVTPTHDYATDSVYTVVLTVTDDGGASDTASQSVTAGNVATIDVHVGDLDGASAAAARNRWEATVAIAVHDVDDNPVPNATVSGAWSNGVNGGGSCITDGSGQCSIGKNNIKGNAGSVTFTVNDVAGTGYSYVSGANHDPDGDSDGTTIVVSQ